MSPDPLKLNRHPTGILEGMVQLPASKSISNRALIIDALTRNKCTLHNLSDAHDTVLMQQLLATPGELINTEDAGTVMRFLTAYFAITNQAKTLTGTARMQERPIALLVEALRELGAEIDYLNTEGYPPLRIAGMDLSWPAQAIVVPGHISSQYISALLLIAPLLPYGLDLTISGTISSWPYIEMTLDLMKHFGAVGNWQKDTIRVEPVPYHAAELQIEPDWSAAGYWYSLAALADEATLFLPGLTGSSIQADKMVVEYMSCFGVDTTFTEEGVILQNTNSRAPEDLIFNFTNCPDLAPSILVVAAAKGIGLTATGLASLRIKETDRVSALQTELAKIGATLASQQDDTWQLLPRATPLPAEIFLNTYSDHRIAMAFAPLALLMPLTIQEPDVVRKSYPEFWKHLAQAGFTQQ